MVWSSALSFSHHLKKMVDNNELIAKSLEGFGRSVRSAARILWRGDDPNALFNFADTLNAAVFRGYEQAWREGAKTCGILPEDRTPEEQVVLAEYISVAQSRILPLGDFIGTHSRANGGKWGDLQPRLNVWINRYNEIVARAQQMSCKDTKLKWVYGDTQHCSTCLKLNGRIYRASIWQAYDIYPQDTRPGHLNCRGFNCQCRFEPTTEPVTPGRPPNVP